MVRPSLCDSGAAERRARYRERAGSIRRVRPCVLPNEDADWPRVSARMNDVPAWSLLRRGVTSVI